MAARVEFGRSFFLVGESIGLHGRDSLLGIDGRRLLQGHCCGLLSRVCCAGCVARCIRGRSRATLPLAALASWGVSPANRVIGVGEFVVQLKVTAQSALGRRDMLTSPCFGVLLVPPVHTTLFSVQNKQFFGHFVWDPQCFLRLRSLHVNAINPYVGYWTGASALQQLRQPVTMETRYIYVDK